MGGWVLGRELALLLPALLVLLQLLAVVGKGCWSAALSLRPCLPCVRQVVKSLCEMINKKDKKANVKPFMAKNYLWVFVNCLIENPAFDSQAREVAGCRQGWAAWCGERQAAGAGLVGGCRGLTCLASDQARSPKPATTHPTPPATVITCRPRTH